MNLYHTFYSNYLISKLKEDFLNLNLIVDSKPMNIATMDGFLTLYTNGKFLQMSDNSIVIVNLVHMLFSISDHDFSSMNHIDVEDYLYKEIYSQIYKLKLEIEKISNNIHSFYPILHLSHTSVNDATFQTFFHYSVGGYAFINKEVYYEAQKNQQNQML